MNNSISVILPAVIVAAAAVLVLLADLFAGLRKELLAWVAAAGLVVAAAVAAGQWTTWKGGFAVWRLVSGGGLVLSARTGVYGFDRMVRLDRYGLFFTILFCAVGVLTVMLSDGYLAQHKVKPGEFYALLLFVVAGMIGMAVSTDLIALLVSFELMSLPSYVLAGMLRADRRSARPR